MSRKRPPALLPLMPKPTAPIWLGDQCYACNPQGLHVPLSTLSVEQLRCAICYRGEATPIAPMRSLELNP